MPEATYTPPRFPWAWLAAGVLLLAGMVAWGVAVYPHLPDRIPQHIGGGGVDAWTDKSVGAAFTLVFVYAGVTVLLPVTAALLLRATPAAELPDGEPRFAIGGSQRPATRTGARRMAVALLVTNIGIGLSFVIANIVMWRTTTTPEVPWWFFVGILTPIAIGAALTLAVGVQDRRQGNKLHAAAGSERGNR
ncbi:DUF1648 domain-containing protein [Streptomyces sp. NBC_00006]|uniref:DUF1648 domain-containing protein n=1 Tax=unclassified Streptomyces TaxID=2593676 RepID=UPI002257ABAC|nr:MULTISPECIES: DUF1648 domain-containing protein [unclassified Streptomyces]MCX4830621.1 DUF1648 domain-containing protein [Streptomyces sp. NBC_01016]MCX5530070.1 DUF1648 domain-containing protein [Streptomyces sp. NBC_00006]